MAGFKDDGSLQAEGKKSWIRNPRMLADLLASNGSVERLGWYVSLDDFSPRLLLDDEI
jgi:hypothetical protein